MSRRLPPLAVASLALVACLLVGASPAAGQDPPPAAPDGFTAEPLTPDGRVVGSKAPTSRVAESDPELLERTDAERVPVLVKLDYDSIATYEGGIAGLPATSPGVTGRALTERDATASAYARDVERQEAEITDAITEAVPEATIGRRLRVVYGGVALTLPAGRAADLLEVPGVVAVQPDTLNQPLTDASPDFIGAPAVWEALGSDTTAGAGVLYGSLDSGLWPEHPSFAADPALPAAPTRPDGSALECDYGDNPLTPASDPFPCNDKLVGGSAFIDTYLQQVPEPAEVYPDSARDSNGHGTHTATTSAGGPVATAPVFGVDRGPVSGVAPGAHVMGYKVCGALGCFTSDTAAAVEAAILDGVDVINFSISGGENPFADATELAFLDAYAAGVFVSTSAGNDGPGAGTANHLSPWTTSVAASTQRREHASTLTLEAGDGATATFDGASIGTGVAGPLPVVRAAEVEGYDDPLCAEAPPAADTFAGLIVACQRGNPAGRVASGYTVLTGGGEGMVMYNLPLQDALTDNHWVPTIHLADGTELLAFLDDHEAVTGSFTPGEKREGQPDVVAAFSSRGPAGGFLKPDVTAPGVQVLAGTTPTPEDITGGPPGELFQAIAGTSMSSPHVAGAGALLAALHPDWSPGQIRSALMTTATTDLVKEDLTTPADPLDVGAGRIDLAAAMDPGLTLDEEAADFLALTSDPVGAADLNIPSVNAPLMPGRLTTTRTFTNVGPGTATYAATARAGEGSTITVSPDRFTVAEGASVELTITIESANDGGQEFGEVRLTARGRQPLHLPVAFVPVQAGVAVTQGCTPAEVALDATSTCTVTVANEGFGDTTVAGTTTVDHQLRVTGATGATVTGGRTVALEETELEGRSPGVPSLAPKTGGPEEFLPLDAFGVQPIEIGDEEIVNLDVPEFTYNGTAATRIGVDSNGYLIVGGATDSTDNACCPPQVLPDPARPNNVLAPFWSDLTGEGAPGIRATVLTDGVDDWTVVEWDVTPWGDDTPKRFQVWLRAGATQGITFAYPADDLPDATGLSEALVVGAENEDGSGGQSVVDTPPTGDVAVESTDPSPGGSLTYTVEVTGRARGTGHVRTEVTASGVPGTTVVGSEVEVTGDALPGVEAYVDGAYRDLLGRPADADGLAFWSARLRAGLPLAAFATSLVRTDEHLVPLVVGHYEHVVGRTPAVGERTYWADRFRTGTSPSLLVSQLVGSAEMAARAGHDTTALVDQGYLALTGRLPDADGRAYWVDRLDGGLSASRFGHLVYGSAEVRGRRATAQAVHLLGRAPTDEERAAWSELLRTRDDLALTVAIVASEAYAAPSG